MKKILLTKELPISDREYQEQYNIIIPGRMLPGDSEGEDPFALPSKEILTEEQLDYLEGTVLHSLVEPNTYVIINVKTEEGKTLELPITPVKLSDLQPETVYSPETRQLAGTRIRLPAVHTNANRIFYHQKIGNPARLDTLYLSYAGDVTRLIDDCLLRTRFAPAVMGIAMCGDWLQPQQVAFPKDLAREFIMQLVNVFRKKAKDETDKNKQKFWMDKTENLYRRLQKYGVGILSGLPNMVMLRNPATVHGAVERKTLMVADFPGAAVYTTTKDMDRSAGDNDGDDLFVFNPDDPEGLATYNYCMNSTPYMIKKVEKLDVATNTAYKNNYSRVVSLLSTSWTSEKELNILKEFNEKNIIGQAWYALMHYNFLCAHFSKDLKYISFNKRFRAIQERARQYPESDIALELRKFIRAVHNKMDGFLLAPDEIQFTHVIFDQLNEDELYHWAHLCYVAIAHAFFPIYEIIFDLRKGDGRPPFNPSEVISGLMGYSKIVDWSGMEQANVWTDLLKLVYEDLPKVEETGQVDVALAVSEFPAFYHLVNKRRMLTTSNRFMSTQLLTKNMNKDNFAGWVCDQLLLGK